MSELTRAELHVVLNDWFCWCGAPEAAAASLRDLLALYPLYEPGKQEALDRLMPDEGVQHLVLYMLGQLKLAEHGGSVHGGWLSDKGKQVLAALRREGEADAFEKLCEGACIHGVALSERCEICWFAHKLGA